jgi:hypothetical protein
MAVGVNRLILLAFLTGTLLQACRSSDSIVDPGPTEQPDTSGPVLETPQMWCTLLPYYNGPHGIDTITISWQGLNSLPEFYVRAIRQDTATGDTIVLMNNRDQYKRFWYNDRLVSAERWIKPGRWRVELVAHDTWEVLGTTTPDLTVRYLKIDSVSDTEILAGSRFTVYLYKALTGPNGTLTTYFPSEVTAWLDDKQLKIFPGDQKEIYAWHWWFWLSVEATSVGSGRIIIKDARCNEIAYGPQITISHPPYSVYFKTGDLNLTTNVSWHSTYTVHSNGELKSRRETTYTDDSTFIQQLYRYCCDSTTKGDTSKFTRTDGRWPLWQAIIVVDTSSSSCPYVRLFIDYMDKPELPRRYNLEFRNMPATISSDGTWIISLDAEAFSRHITTSSFWFGYSDYERGGTSTRLDANGQLLLDGSQSLSLVLKPR